MNNNRRLKFELMKVHPFCYWCSTPVKVYDNIPIGQTHPFDEATIDHMKSRFFRKRGEKVPKVLACSKCNNKRAVQEEKELRRAGKIFLTYKPNEKKTNIS